MTVNQLENVDLNTTVISDIMDADFRISNFLTAAKLDEKLESEVDAWARSHQVYLARNFQF